MDMQRDPHYESVISEIYSFLGERIEFAVSAGIRWEQIIIDPRDRIWQTDTRQFNDLSRAGTIQDLSGG